MGIAKPITNITTIASNVIGDTRATIATASSLGPQLTAISAAMSAYATTMRTDSCGIAAWTNNPWPPASLATTAGLVDDAAAQVTTVSAGPVQTLDDTLAALDDTLISANGTLVVVAEQAKTVTDGPIMEFLEDTLSPINGKVSASRLLLLLLLLLPRGTSRYLEVPR